MVAPPRRVRQPVIRSLYANEDAVTIQSAFQPVDLRRRNPKNPLQDRHFRASNAVARTGDVKIPRLVGSAGLRVVGLEFLSGHVEQNEGIIITRSGVGEVRE